MEESPKNPTSLTVRATLREFHLPPVEDALVIGRDAPIGAEAMSRALKLLHVASFVNVPVDQDGVHAVLVRESLLRKVSREKLLELVTRRVIPFMAEDEVIHLEIEPELHIEERL